MQLTLCYVVRSDPFPWEKPLELTCGFCPLGTVSHLILLFPNLQANSFCRMIFLSGTCRDYSYTRILARSRQDVRVRMSKEQEKEAWSKGGSAYSMYGGRLFSP